MKCCICGKEIKGSGHNPSPFIGAKCCDKCNGELVVPLRMVLNDRKTAVVLKPNQVGIIKPNDQYFSLKELQNLVDGYIEIAPEIIPGFITIVNEEGLIKNLPFNVMGNLLFGVSYVGNVVIVPKEIFEKPEQ